MLVTHSHFLHQFALEYDLCTNAVSIEVNYIANNFIYLKIH